jgi:outer membrane protein assembly factor BamB
MGGVVVFREGGMMMPGRGGVQQQQQQPVGREELIASWRNGGWRPTGRLLFDNGKVYLKTPDRLVCYSTAAHSNQPVWQSAWENRYELDGMSQMLAMMAINYGIPQQAGTRPKSPPEVMLFGDRVHQSLAIDGGVIYTLEGKRVGVESRPPPAGVRPFQHGVTPRRSRGNWLTAYQASGGKALWTRAASDDDKEGSSDIGFLSAPVPCGSLLLAPVTDGGTVWLLGLDRATGKTVWRSYLCDEPQGGASPWSEVTIAVEGREAYLTCGCGVVFAVDAVGGTVRWAVRYQRDGRPNQTMRNYGIAQTTLDLNGWEDDVVIPHGQYLVVMSSDSDQLTALDRRTGQFAWNSPRTSPFSSVASYCLGVQGRGLFVAGKNIVRRYDIPSGRLVWEKEIDDSFGRGCVTEDAVYVPVKDSILKLDPANKRELAQVGVALTSDEPVGNLFSDGEKLWAVGAGRVYAMTTLEHRMKLLEEQIASGDGEARLNRMRLYFKQNRPELALADLRGAYALFQARLTPDDAALRLFAAINEMKLTQREPVVTLHLLTDLFVRAPSLPQLGKEALSRRADVLASTVSVVRQQKTAGALPLLLAAAPLFTEEYLLSAATLAVDGAASKEHVATLLDALRQNEPTAQLLSIRAATRLATDDVKAPLARLLSAGDDRVRLAAARSLANLGQRQDVLETLIALLESPTPRIRSRSQQSLRALTGQQINFAPEGKAEDRAASIAQWKQWLAASGATAKLNLPLSDQTVPLGRTLYVSQGQGTVTELDAENKERWKQSLPGPAWGCQGLPNGHRLIAVYSHSMVVEYDDTGKEVWRKDRLPGAPYSVQRLENGNTLLACADINQLVEVAPDGSTTSISVQGRPMSAQRLENGNTLCALQQANRVVEVDRAGKVVWEARTTNPPGHAVRLDSGNTLVCLTYGRQVVEFDPSGKNIVWKSAVSLSNPYVAQRLPSGNTLVADHQGIHEIDATGRQFRRQHRQQQVTGLSSY